MLPPHRGASITGRSQKSAWPQWHSTASARHLAGLLVRLGNFETYSGECVSRSSADAALHRHIQEVTAGARASLEAALERVAEEEGIPLP